MIYWKQTPVKEVLSIDGPPVTIGAAGYYRVVLREKDETVIQDTGWVKNKLMNYFFARSVNYDVNFPTLYGAIGTGTGTPTGTDNALWGSQLGSRPNPGIWEGGYIIDGQYARHRFKYRWEVGDGIGTISEVGMFTAGTGGTMMCHATLKDSGGSPTTIVKGADNIVDVFWEHRKYPITTAAVTGVLDLSGTAYNYSIQPVDLAWHTYPSWNGTYGGSYMGAGYTAADAFLEQTYPGLLNDTSGFTSCGSLFGVSGCSFGPYARVDTGPFYTDNLVQIGIDGWLNQPIGSIFLEMGGSRYQCIYSRVSDGNPIPKTNEERLRLRYRFTVAEHVL